MRDQLVLMKLRAAREHCFDEGNTYTASHVTQQIYCPGNLAAFFFGYTDVRCCIDWNEKQGKAERLQDAVICGCLEIDLKVDVGTDVKQRKRAKQKAYPDEPPRCDLSNELPGNGHQED